MFLQNKPFLTLLICSLHFISYSQVCRVESLDIRHQSDIDEFVATSGGCSIIKGDVYIREEFDGLIRDLSGLSQIQVIEGSLTIRDNVTLTTLTGLEHVDSVYREVRIFSNYSLQNIDALSNLRYAGNGIAMSNLPSLTTGDTFNHLQVLSKLTLYSLSFENLSMFSKLHTIGSLSIGNMDNLENLSGLNALTTAGNIELEYNVLHDLQGLENLIQLDTFALYQNYSITSLDGLENLQILRGQLALTNNPELSSISAIEHLPVDSLNQIYVQGNPKLSACNIKLLCDAFSASGNIEVEIQYNGPGCESAMDMITACHVTCPTQLVFTSQEEIDAFPVQFSNCSIIEGDVKIEGNDIYNLDSLYTLTQINGSLYIGTRSLKNLKGLDNLGYIGGTLELYFNDSLFNLTGLENLVTLHTLIVSRNPRLNNLEGLDALQHLHHLQLFDLPSADGLVSLKKVTGNMELKNISIETGNFPLLDTIEGGLYLRELAFNELTGLENIKSVNTLRIWSSEMTGLHGLSGLLYVNDTLDISYNDSLETLSGLNNQLEIGGDVRFYSNDKLENLAILNSMDTIHGDLHILYNRNLRELDDLLNLEHVKGSLNLTNNNLSTFLGLEKLSRVDKDLTIKLEPGVKSLEGFSGLNFVGEDLTINIMDSITSLAGLQMLDSIGGDFIFDFNRKVISFNGLSQLKSIGGTFHLYNNWNLRSLEGLENLQRVGSLYFEENSDLNNIISLSNLEVITGGIHFIKNLQVKDLPDWTHIKVIAGDFIFENTGFRDFSGLDSLERIEGDVSIFGFFSTLRGLEQLKYCGKGMTLKQNQFQNVNELAALEEINGPLILFGNHSLENLNGLSNLKLEHLHGVTGGYAVEIYNNERLTDCSVAFLCEALLTNEKPVWIQKNNRGCSYDFEIEISCNFSHTCLPGGIIFTRQSQIDSFPINYPGCSFINGDVFIEELVDGDINNIDSLVYITDIAGPLYIRSNMALTNLDGFEGLVHVTGGINIISNDELVSIEGLRNIDAEFIATHNWLAWDLRLQANDKLTDCAIAPVCSLFVTPNTTVIIGGNGPTCETIEAVRNHCAFPSVCSLGRVEYQKTIDEFPLRYPNCTELTGDLEIASIPQLSYINDLSPLQQLTKINGQLYINNNPNLVNLDGLHHLTEINGPIVVRWNELLDDISALSHIDPSSVTPVFEDHITIYRNELLTDCAIESICALLADDQTSSDIDYNIGNCTSPEEVREACLIINTDDDSREGAILLYPNPTTGLITVELGNHRPDDIKQMQVYDSMGRVVRKASFTPEISIEGFSPGIYTIVFIDQHEFRFSSRIMLIR